MSDIDTRKILNISKKASSPLDNEKVPRALNQVQNPE